MSSRSVYSGSPADPSGITNRPARPREPPRSNERAVPTLPGPGQFPDPIGMRCGEILRLTDVVRQVVELRGGKVTKHGRVSVEERSLARLHQLPVAFANGHHAAEAPVEGLVRRTRHLAREVREKIDPVELPFGPHGNPSGGKRRR